MRNLRGRKKGLVLKVWKILKKFRTQLKKELYFVIQFDFYLLDDECVTILFYIFSAFEILKSHKLKL